MVGKEGRVKGWWEKREGLRVGGKEGRVKGWWEKREGLRVVGKGKG